MIPPREVDRQLLGAVRRVGSARIDHLTDTLGVTATAVRQRVTRLLDDGLLQRTKISVGRGRPTYEYTLTDAGERTAGASLSEFTDALWAEVVAIEDEAIRHRIVEGVARRVASSLAAEMGDLDDPALDDAARIRRLQSALTGRKIDVRTATGNGVQSVVTIGSTGGGLPVLDIDACPYPSLSTADEDRSMCRLEQQMLSEALGRPVQLSHCRLDGDRQCRFEPAPTEDRTT